MVNIGTDEEFNLWVLLAQTRESLYKARQKELVKYDISPRQSAALFIIKTIAGSATAAEIARYLFRELHSTYEMLCRMEKSGLIKCAKNRNKTGRVIYKLTTKGLKAYNQAMKRDSIREIISCLTREEREQLKSSLKKLRDTALKILALNELPFPPV